MKKLLLFCLFIVVFYSLNTYGQAPEKFSYQAVVRDSLGNTLKNKNISVRIMLLKGLVNELPIYGETFNVTTNQNGIINLTIGGGVWEFGYFPMIDWSSDSYLIKIEVDADGGMKYKFLGKSQLMSVPYALYAKKSGTPGTPGAIGPTGADGQQGIAGPTGPIVQGTAGQTLRNDGSNWVANSTIYNSSYNVGVGTSTPSITAILDVSSSNKGLLPPRLTSSQRDAIYAPAEGLFIYNTDTKCVNYYMGKAWHELCGPCTPYPSAANAGTDILCVNASSVKLNATAPDKDHGKGLWKILEGNKGEISEPNNINSLFYGYPDSLYKLEWSVSTPCDTSRDIMYVSFYQKPTKATVASNQKGLCDQTTITANTPVVGKGSWRIVSGTGGQVVTPASPTSLFNGKQGQTYVVRWCIKTKCDSSYAQVTLEYVPAVTTADAGSDQTLLGETHTALAANTPVVGAGKWYIVSGTGYKFDNISSPTSGFSGTAGSTYELKWTITNDCKTVSSDNVTISFPLVCGGLTELTDTRDSQTYPIVEIGKQCWMAKNINVGTMILNTATQPNDGYVQKYCYGNIPNNCTTYGGLYIWDETVAYGTNGDIGICPTGWHIPSSTEWNTMIELLDTTIHSLSLNTWIGTDIGTKLKSGGSSGFNTLLAGDRNYASGNNYAFEDLGSNGLIWSGTSVSGAAYVYLLGSNTSKIWIANTYKQYGFSVRCLKD